MLDQDPLDASKRAAKRRALCLDLVDRIRADGPIWLRAVRDKTAVTATLDDVAGGLLKIAEGVPMDEILAAQAADAHAQDGIVEEVSRENLHELFELTTRSRAEAERSLRHLRQNKGRLLARAADRDATERLLEKLETGFVRSAAASTREMRRYQHASDAHQPLLLVKRGKRAGSDCQ